MIYDQKREIALRILELEDRISRLTEQLRLKDEEIAALEADIESMRDNNRSLDELRGAIWAPVDL